MKIVTFIAVLLLMALTACGGEGKTDDASATAVAKQEIKRIVEEELKEERQHEIKRIVEEELKKERQRMQGLESKRKADENTRRILDKQEEEYRRIQDETERELQRMSDGAERSRAEAQRKYEALFGR
jgi:Skp family chaperone for outer membrane proteins